MYIRNYVIIDDDEDYIFKAVCNQADLFSSLFRSVWILNYTILTWERMAVI